MEINQLKYLEEEFTDIFNKYPGDIQLLSKDILLPLFELYNNNFSNIQKILNNINNIDVIYVSNIE